MPAKRALTGWSLALAIAVPALSGCGGSVQVHPSAPAGSSRPASRGRVDSPLTSMRNHLACLREDRLAVQVKSSTRLQVGAPPAGATIVFAATPGAAQAYQINGSSQGAEVIGSALVYPNHAPGSVLSAVESCLAQGVQG